jgi:hypothetical protein
VIAASDTPARDRPGGVCLPCSEACAAFHPLNYGGWSRHGLCRNFHCPSGGFPVRPGRDCSHYMVRHPAKITRHS